MSPQPNKRMVNLIALFAPIVNLFLGLKAFKGIYNKPKLLSQGSSNIIQKNDFEQRRSQVLTFKEPKTGTTIKLVGCIHGNYGSIKLAEELVEDSAKRGVLKAVLIELCPTRYEGMVGNDLEIRKKSSKRFEFDNEMLVSSYTATKYNVPTVLGDQDVEITESQIKNIYKETWKDILKPFHGGWKKMYDDIGEENNVIDGSGPGYLSFFNYLDPKLLRHIPTAVCRYVKDRPLSFTFRLFLPTVLNLIFDSILPSNFTTIATTAAKSVDKKRWTLSQSDIKELNTWITIYSFSSIIKSITKIINVMDQICQSRVMSRALLFERNQILATNILKICMSKHTAFSGQWRRDSFIDQVSTLMHKLFPNISSIVQVARSAVMKDNKPKEVISILGMAHCNGIKKLLLQSSYELTSSIDVNTVDLDLYNITVLYPIK